MSTQDNKARHSHFWTAKSQRVMLASIIVGVLVCVLLFSFVGVYMGQNSRQTVDNIGEVNMKDTGLQMTKRFETVMEQRLQMIRSLLEEYKRNLKNGADVDEANRILVADAGIRDFQYIAFYRVNEEYLEDPERGSTFDILATDSNLKFDVTDKVPFRTSVLSIKQLDGKTQQEQERIKSNAEKIAVGVGQRTDNSGQQITEDIILLSIPFTDYVMADGIKSMSLIAAIPNVSLVEMLGEIDKETQLKTGAYIIRRNDANSTADKSNSFVLQGKDQHYGYFSEYLEQELKGADLSKEKLLAELNTQIDKGEPYSTILHIDDNHIHMYCNKLPKSEWYLVTVTNNTQLNTMINSLTEQWIVMIIVAIVAIIVVLTVIFVLYHYYNKQNMLLIETAREEAIHANKAKSEFLSNMSHDIRTPMNAIVGMTAIARANLGNEQQVADCLKKIALSSKHLLGLINDVLDMSKIESGKMTLNMEQVSLREVLDGITTIIQPQIKIKRQNFNVIVRRIEQENVYCDSVRLNQVLLNLLSNAIKFTAEEGTIEIYLDQEESPLGDDYVRTHLRVKDNGIGMSEEFQKKIFESFTREDSKRVHHTEGSGLGMAITKYIVDAMKGTIELKSELNMGTQFHITLDLERATVPEEEMILPNWKMLIVDDDQQLCETTVVALKDIGVDSEWTLDGETAVEMTVKAHDTRKPYDIILLDWRLPGIDGIETAKRIRKRLGEDVPILLISAYDWTEIETEARAAGICGFISKPLFKSTLFYGLKSFAGTDDAATEKVEESKKINLSGIRVLLAEDNELNWEIAETLLDSVGITCDHAENGQQCVDMFKESAAGTYQAILMDIRMPLMNGYEATEEIRKLNHPDKDLPIIAMTADAFADDMKKCLECGMNAHIARPIDIDTVQKTIARFIKK